MQPTSAEKGSAAGRCYCGAVEFVARFPSKFCAHCHCANCRRAHGAAFVTWVGFERDQVEIRAADGKLARYATDTGATRTFCAACGTTLFFESPRWAGEIHVVRSNFDGAIDREVEGNAFYRSHADWMDFSVPIERPRS